MYSKRHELKVWPAHFRELIAGRKTAEYRRDDRGFNEGDTLWLREWSRTDGYSGREACAVITCITRTDPLPLGFAMLSLGRVTVWHAQQEAAR